MVAVVALFAVALPAPGAHADPDRGGPARPAAPAKITAEPRRGAAPVFLTPGRRASLLKSANAARDTTADALNLGAKQELRPKDVVRDADGTVHVRYERRYAGLPVIGGDLIVHRGGDSRSVTGATSLKSITVPAAGAVVSAVVAGESAVAAADAHGIREPGVDRVPRLVVWAVDVAPVLAWETIVTGEREDGTPSELHVVSDAESGAVLREFDNARAGVGHGQFNGRVDLATARGEEAFELYDARRSHRVYDAGNGIGRPSGTLFTDADDVWGDGTPLHRQTAAVDAAYGAQQTWDFYHERFARNGVGDDGRQVASYVHYEEEYRGAHWGLFGCFCLTYGSGAGNAHPLTALDIVAHEMTHGVTETTAGLLYSGESGGLNEATSDIMAAAVEFFANNPEEVADYHVGERVDFNGDGTPMRSMDEPSKTPGSSGIPADYWSPELGQLEVHLSSGPANHFFYLLAEGSGSKTIGGVAYDSPTYDGEPVAGIGLRNATDVWYRALTRYMTSTTNYAGAREATLQAAADLFGRSGDAYAAVADAWAAVNVGSRLADRISFKAPSGQETAVGQPVRLGMSAATARPAGLTYAATGLPDGLVIDSATGSSPARRAPRATSPPR